MKPHHVTHCALRLGDNLAHLHFLRKLAKSYPDLAFTHFCHSEYLPDLREVVQDVPAIRLTAFQQEFFIEKWTVQPPPALESIDAWKNAGGFWVSHPLKLDYCGFMLAWFQELAKRMGLISPFKTREDLLFDYPALKQPKVTSPFDLLIVNSPPLSGQAARYRLEEMDRLILQLADRYRIVTTHKRPFDVPCTAELKSTVTGIGRLSQMAAGIIMVATGPCWPTFNIWNTQSVKLRVIINEPEIVDLDPKAFHVADVTSLAGILREQGKL